MVQKLLVVLFALPGLAHAVICKSVGPDGVVSYTDVPADQCQQQVELPAITDYTPRPITRPADAAGSQTEEKSETPAFTGYRAISILQPDPDATVRSNEGKVPVALRLEPTLQPGHKVEIVLDGSPVAGGFGGQAIELSGVQRGTHRLRARVLDQSGKRLIETTEVEFHLRKTGLFDRANRRPPPPSFNPR